MVFTAWMKDALDFDNILYEYSFMYILVTPKSKIWQYSLKIHTCVTVNFINCAVQYALKPILTSFEMLYKYQRDQKLAGFWSLFWVYILLK